ncbi:MAG TPA: response regulator [Thermoanaerobaculia bacterium]|nr:response regulator [Thermoanaerobaculia bacterium]
MARILVVDDDQLIRSLLTSIFEMRGLECVSAAGGEEALKRLAGGGFDLVLLDLMMPGVDGFGVLEALPESHPPVMVATAAAPSVIERVPASRIAAIIAKPFVVDELIATAEELLTREMPLPGPEPARPRADVVVVPESLRETQRARAC